MFRRHCFLAITAHILLALLLTAGAAAAAGSAEYVLADRSASISLPSTWRAIGESGSVIARGPEGLAALGISGHYSYPDEWSADSSAFGQSPYLTPEEFISRCLAQVLAAKAGLPVSHTTLVRSVPTRGFTYPALTADMDLTVADKTWRAVMLVATWQVYGSRRWGFYVSGVTAPQDVFDPSFPNLWRVFVSFHPEPPYRAGNDPEALSLDMKRLGEPRSRDSVE